VVFVCIIGIAPAAQAATELSVPDSTGAYVHCKAVGHALTSSSAGAVGVSCQYGPTTGRVTGFQLNTTTGSNPIPPCWNPSNGAKVYGSTTSLATWTVTRNQGGLFQASWVGFGGANTCGVGSTTFSASSISLQIDGTTRAGTLDSITSASAYPTYPSDYYPGGTAGNSIPVVCFESVYSSEGSAPVVVDLDATCARNVGDGTYGWAETGGSATLNDTAGKSVQLTVTDDGTTDVTLTITREGTSYDLTQSVTVPKPAASRDTTTDLDDDDCPTGWGWLNPFTVGEILRCLFIPTEIGSNWDTLTATVEGSYPAGPLVWVVETAGDAYAGMDAGITYAAEHPTWQCSWGPEVTLGDDEVTVPVIPGTGDPESCGSSWGLGDQGAPAAMAGIQGVSRPVSTIVFYVGGLLAVYRIVSGAFGSGGGTSGGSGDS